MPFGAIESKCQLSAAAAAADVHDDYYFQPIFQPAVTICLGTCCKILPALLV